jgi:hypothetical protein
MREANVSPSPIIAAVVTATLVCAMGVAMARLPADAATPALKVSRVNYDPAGTDLRTNTMYNKETVTVTNTTGVARSLKGWTVRDMQNHVYTFGNVTVKARGSVVLHTGSGTNTATQLYWRQSNYVWNNTGDTAVLRNSTRATVHSCKWTTLKPGYKIC